MISFRQRGSRGEEAVKHVRNFKSPGLLCCANSAVVCRLAVVDVKKAIITAGGKTQRTLPLQSLVDRDGVPKTALQIIVEEILETGVGEICVIVCPGDQAAYANAAGAYARRIQFVEQAAPLGYGHAVNCARDF